MATTLPKSHMAGQVHASATGSGDSDMSVAGERGTLATPPASPTHNHLCRNALGSTVAPAPILAHPADEPEWPEPREPPMLAHLPILAHSPLTGLSKYGQASAASRSAQLPRGAARSARSWHAHALHRVGTVGRARLSCCPLRLFPLSPMPSHPSRPCAPSPSLSRPYALRGGGNPDAPASSPNLPRVRNPGRFSSTKKKRKKKRPRSGQEARPHAKRRDERRERSVGTREGSRA